MEKKNCKKVFLDFIWEIKLTNIFTILKLLEDMLK